MEASKVRKMAIWAAGAAAALTAASTAVFATTGSTSPISASIRSHAISPVLAENFSVFSPHSSGHFQLSALQSNFLLSALQSQYPTLAQEVANMQSPSDPSYHLQLDFAAATLEVLPAGPMVLIPGAEGACVLMQVPAGLPSNPQVEAIGACNTTANIIAAGGIGAQYGDPPLDVDIAYGMSSNGTASAQLVNSNGQAEATEMLQDNGYAIRVPNPSRLVFRNDHNQMLKVEHVGSLAK